MTNTSDIPSERLMPPEPVVAKFGGTSMAEPEQVLRVIEACVPEGSIITPSAPGVTDDRPKVTDLLEQVAKGHRQFIGEAVRRMSDYADRLGLLASGRHIDNFREDISNSVMEDYIVSRGEHYTGLILAQALDVPFIRGDSFMGFERNGRVDRLWTRQAIESCFLGLGTSAVAGAFYGISTVTGEIKVFSRGGSDRTGAILAATLNRPYYNWTDRDGVASADPDHVNDPLPVREITRGEMREMAVGGATILHPDALVDLNGSDVVVSIRNTTNPTDPGTQVVLERNSQVASETIIGLAARDDIRMLSVTKVGMNEIKGYEARLADLFAENGVSLEITKTSVDTLSIGFHSKEIDDPDAVIRTVLDRLENDSILRPTRTRSDSFGAVYLVGQRLRLDDGLVSEVGLAARQALREQGIVAREFGAIDGESIGLLVSPEQTYEALQVIHDHLITKKSKAWRRFAGFRSGKRRPSG